MNKYESDSPFKVCKRVEIHQELGVIGQKSQVNIRRHVESQAVAQRTNFYQFGFVPLTNGLFDNVDQGLSFCHYFLVLQEKLLLRFNQRVIQPSDFVSKTWNDICLRVLIDCDVMSSEFDGCTRLKERNGETLITFRRENLHYEHSCLLSVALMQWEKFHIPPLIQKIKKNWHPRRKKWPPPKFLGFL